MICKKCSFPFDDSFLYCPMCGAGTQPKKRRRRRMNGEGTVFPRGKTYSVRITLGHVLRDGKRIQKYAEKGGFKTQREALAYTNTLRAEHAAPRVHGVDYSKNTFRQLYDRFSDRHAKRVTKGTMDCYRAAYKYFTDIYDMPFSELNTEDWQMCIDDCPKGLRTKQNMKALGTLLYKLAAELRVFGVNTDTDFAALVWLDHEDQESRQPFTLDELSKIKSGADAGVPYADWILAMCYTGFRPSEFLALDAASLDSRAWTLRGGAKTEAGKNRIVPVHPLIRPILARRALSGSAFLFSDRPHEPLELRRFRETMFYPCLAACGIQPVPDGKEKPSRTPYSCRHTFSTLMKNVPGSAKDKAALMGHTSYEMTLHYQHEDYDSLKKIIESIA